MNKPVLTPSQVRGIRSFSFIAESLGIGYAIDELDKQGDLYEEDLDTLSLDDILKAHYLGYEVGASSEIDFWKKQLRGFKEYKEGDLVKYAKTVARVINVFYEDDSAIPECVNAVDLESDVMCTYFVDEIQLYVKVEDVLIKEDD